MPDVGGTCPDSNIVLRACRDAGFEPDVRLAFDDYPALQGMAAAGVGVALIPSLATANIRADVAVIAPNVVDETLAFGLAKFG